MTDPGGDPRMTEAVRKSVLAERKSTTSGKAELTENQPATISPEVGNPCPQDFYLPCLRLKRRAHFGARRSRMGKIRLSSPPGSRHLRE
jgi:hypothetical protein